MPISPYSTPAQQNQIALQDYTPVAMIGNAFARMDARGEAGMAAADKLADLGVDLSSRVLPEQQGFADEYMSEINDFLGELGESGEYMDSLPKIRRYASRITQKFQRLGSNFDAVTSRREEIADLLSKDPNAFVKNDMNYYLNDELNRLKSDPDAQFNAPLLRGRVDRGELVKDLIGDLDPIQESYFDDTEGVWLTRTVKQKTDEQIYAAGMDMLMSNPAVMAEMERDAAYARENNPNFQEDYVKTITDYYTQERLSIGDLGDELSVEEESLMLEGVKDREEEHLSTITDRDADRAFITKSLQNDIRPYTYQGRQETIRRQANPFYMENIRQNNRRALKSTNAKDTAARMTVPGSAFGTPIAGYSVSMNHSGRIDSGEHYAAQLQLELKDEGLSPTLVRAKTQTLDTVLTNLAASKELLNTAADNLGVTLDAIAAAEKGKPIMPDSMSADRYREIMRIINNETPITKTRMTKPFVGIGGVEVAYIDEYRAWKGGLSEVEEALMDDLDDEMSEMWKNRGSRTAGMFDLKTADEEAQVQAIIDGMTGLSFYKGTIAKGDKKTEDFPRNLTLVRMSVTKVTDENNERGYAIEAKDEDGVLWTMISHGPATSELERFLNVTADPAGRNIRSWAGEFLDSAGPGQKLEPFIGGADILGDGYVMRIPHPVTGVDTGEVIIVYPSEANKPPLTTSLAEAMGMLNEQHEAFYKQEGN